MFHYHCFLLHHDLFLRKGFENYTKDASRKSGQNLVHAQREHFIDFSKKTGLFMLCGPDSGILFDRAAIFFWEIANFEYCGGVKKKLQNT